MLVSILHQYPFISITLVFYDSLAANTRRGESNSCPPPKNKRLQISGLNLHSVARNVRLYIKEMIAPF